MAKQTRRVQVFIDQVSSAYLDRLTLLLGTQTAAVEYGLACAIWDVDDEDEQNPPHPRLGGASTDRFNRRGETIPDPADADLEPTGFNDPAQEKRQQARTNRKAALADEIKAALPANPDVLNAAGAVVQEARHHRGGTKGGALPSTVQKKIDTLEQVTTVGGTYCPRHTPKSCEPDCKFRVNV